MRRFAFVDRTAGAFLLAAAALVPGRATAADAQDAQAATHVRQTTVHGRVVDAATLRPLPAASLLLLSGTDTVATGRSDDAGAFRASGARGAVFTLEVRRLGYAPGTVSWRAPEADTTIVIELRAVPQALGEVEVRERAPGSSRLQGFENRARLKAGGSFVLRENIVAWHPRRTTDVMRRVFGVRLVDSSGTLLAASTRGDKVDLKNASTLRSWSPCFMRVGVDGQVKEWGFDMDSIEPEHIHGIEVYSGPATIPSEYNSARKDGYCGLVMIWTRAGY
jgi:hypothetical protein